ncbi:hypothetical protein [Mycolicibacterium chlorophenolicum]|uniref:Uncharacterized protein n=1 Tax=Mycolicibacterium chlorophenolicum TaxID=37916 RepID=A0A0J6WKL5_9MYCO|nr:hypothetical protein [Mycolicibacterium chlorophenolicum]KMO82528.1 hypothetical protein MCHLDSM_01151 [Mycolicibacterium chlorophenolicum]
MTFTATITDLAADSAPLWESLGHASAEDAHTAAVQHINTAQPADQVRAVGDGVYEVWSSAESGGSTQHVATLTVVAADD